MNNSEKEFRIAVLDMYDGFQNEGMRCIKKIIDKFSETVSGPVHCTVFDVRQKQEVPGLDFDAYISTGGPGNPVPVGEPWERKFFQFLDQILQFNHNRSNSKKKHLFLICHSFQMASIYWQLAHVSKRRKTSFGTFPVHKTSFGRKDETLSQLGDPFWIVDSRDYQVTQANQSAMEHFGAKVLCLEKIRPHVQLERAIMAIRFSKEVIGTQFHPEADAEGMLRYFLNEEKKQNIISNYGEAKYNEMITHLNDPDKIMMTEAVIIPSFLKNAFEQFCKQEIPARNLENSFQ
jgi:homoserine O-succinyltransferase/O-acetyltransferase